MQAPSSAANTAAVRLFGTDLLTVRIGRCLPRKEKPQRHGCSVPQNKASTLLEIRQGQGRRSEDAHPIVLALPDFPFRRQFPMKDRNLLYQQTCGFVLRNLLTPPEG